MTLAPRFGSILGASCVLLLGSRRRRCIDEIPALAYADRVEIMIRLPAFIVVGCVVCAGLVPIDFGSISSHRPLAAARLPAAPEIRKLADPLLSPTQRRPETASSDSDADSLLRGVRLTGVVIGPDVRLAIFAVTGANSRALSEGQALKGWRLESISRERVVFSGPAGSIVLEPQPDANLVRPPPPVAVPSDPPRAAMADPPGQPIAVTPIAVTPITVVNLPPTTPVQTQGYPDYSQGYYPGYDAYYPWGWGWGWPVGVSAGFGRCWNCGFRGGAFRPAFRRFGFAHASFGGGFRGRGRR